MHPNKIVFAGNGQPASKQCDKTGKPSYKVSVFSNYSGHIHESNSAGMGNNQPEAMQQLAVTTEELSVKEGMYVQKGQNILPCIIPTGHGHC